MFFKEFLRSPGSIGAIKPSSKYLAAEMVAQARISEADTIFELGAGTGPFTEMIIKTKKETAAFVALEINENLVKVLKEKFPDVDIIEDSVENLRNIMADKGIEKIDSIVCGLPWAAFSKELQDKLFNAIVDSLQPGGRFCTFAYLQGLLLPAGQRFRKTLKQNFSKVSQSRTVWRNTPPAFIYNCVK